MSVSVLIVDDHTIVRNGLRRLLESEQDIAVVGEATDGRTAVRLARDMRPDVVLMDVAMPEMNGVEATRSIVAEVEATRVIGLSGLNDSRQVEAMLVAGAAGYLLKDCDADELILAVRRVAAGGRFLGSGVTEAVVNGFLKRSSSGENGVSSGLDEIERRVVQLLANGRSTGEVAERLGLTVKRVDRHRAAIMDKLDLHSVAELTKYAIREGLTSLDT